MGKSVHALTLRLREGDEFAYRDFYDTYGLRLMRYLVTLHNGDVDSAKDTFQKVLMRMGKHIKVFRDEDVFWMWILRLARTTFIDEIRKVSRYQRILQRFGDDDARLESSKGKDGQVAALAEALQVLDDAASRLLQDFYYKGLSYSEIGEALGVSERAVEGRLARAREKLRGLMKKGGGYE